MTRIPLLIFALTLLITGLLAYGLFATQSTDIPGGAHPTIAEMNRGGNPERHADLIVVCGLYGALQIALFVAAICLGIRRDRSSLFPLIVGGAAYIAVFVAMVIAYQQGMEDAPIVLGLPLPTAIMVYGMWSIPVVFVVLYIAKFRDWVYDESDAQLFAQLKHQSQLQPGQRETKDLQDG